MISYKEWIKKSELKLYKNNKNSAKRDAETLLSYCLKVPLFKLLTFDECKIKYNKLEELEKLIMRRERGEPMSYLTGQCSFWSLDLKVSPSTFIPRSDTECLIYNTLNLKLPKFSKVLDLGTGSGAIALALASERSNWKIIGTDLFSDTIDIAIDNSKRLNLKNIIFLIGNWFDPLENKKFNLIVSNPPYISKMEKSFLKKEIFYEPYHALFANNNGLQYLKKIIFQSRKYLLSGGWLVLEHGWKQGDKVRNFFYKAGFYDIETFYDLGLNERVTKGKWNF